MSVCVRTCVCVCVCVSVCVCVCTSFTLRGSNLCALFTHLLLERAGQNGEGLGFEKPLTVVDTSGHSPCP